MRINFCQTTIRLALSAIFFAILATPVRASIQTASATGSATVEATLDNPSEDVIYSGMFGGSAPSSAFNNSLTAPGVAVLTFGLSGPNDYTTADRLILNVTNNTGTPLGSLDVTLGGGATVFNYFGYFSYLGSYTSPPPSMDVTGVAGSGPTGFTYDFNTPLAVGASQAFYIPVDVSNSPTQFTLTEQSVSAIPEPTSLLTFAVLGLFGGGLVWRGRHAAKRVS